MERTNDHKLAMLEAGAVNVLNEVQQTVRQQAQNCLKSDRQLAECRQALIHRHEELTVVKSRLAEIGQDASEALFNVEARLREKEEANMALEREVVSLRREVRLQAKKLDSAQETLSHLTHDNEALNTEVNEANGKLHRAQVEVFECMSQTEELRRL